MSITHFSGPVVVGADSFFVPVAAKTLTAKDNGMTYTISGTGYTYTLPAPFVGAFYRFVTKAVFSTDFIVNGGNSLMHGAVDVNSTRVNWTGASLVNFQDGADTIGDWVEIRSDGTNWYVDGFGEQASSITAT